MQSNESIQWPFYAATPISQWQFNIARDTLLHRGPDAGASFFTDEVALGHRRLSIIDLTEQANQPMHLANRYSIVFNGEIYNYKTLKAALAIKGHTFTTNSDTEILLHLYQAYGHKMLHKLDGMFAFAIWDNQTKELFIARDRLGIKPLYYTQWNNYFLFASEPKAFFAYGVPLQLNEDYVEEFQYYRHVSGENTLFTNVFQLLPGHNAIIKNANHIAISCWWNLKDAVQQHPTISNPLQWFTQTLDASVQKHMISDVPVGLLLSGGLDSSSIGASLFKQQFKGLCSFTMGFNNFIDDESAEAAILANAYQLQHYSYQLTDANLVEALQVCNTINDVPLVHHNEPHIYYVAKNAKNKITVLLSGEGADELLGGYVRYKPLQYANFHTAISFVLQFIPKKRVNSRLEKLQHYFQANNTNELLQTNAIHWYAKDFKK
ncbi:MAG: asparagine synthase (glutamine-hydrolyzing), partial [Flavobacterium sp.]